MPIKGLDAAKRRFTQVINEIVDVKTYRTVEEILIIGGGHAATMTPVDTSTLINSQYRQVEQRAGGIRGQVGYTAAYAAFVAAASGKLKGQPRPGNRGTYWAPGGEPNFLVRGFEDPETQAAIKSAIKKGMSL